MIAATTDDDFLRTARQIAEGLVQIDTDITCLGDADTPARRLYDYWCERGPGALRDFADERPAEFVLAVLELVVLAERSGLKSGELN